MPGPPLFGGGASLLEDIVTNDYLVAKQQDESSPAPPESVKLAFDVLASSPKYRPVLEKLAAEQEAQQADFSGRVLAHSFWAQGQLGAH